MTGACTAPCASLIGSPRHVAGHHAGRPTTGFHHIPVGQPATPPQIHLTVDPHRTGGDGVLGLRARIQQRGQLEELAERELAAQVALDLVDRWTGGRRRGPSDASSSCDVAAHARKPIGRPAAGSERAGATSPTGPRAHAARPAPAPSHRRRRRTPPTPEPPSAPRTSETATTRTAPPAPGPGPPPATAATH